MKWLNWHTFWLVIGLAGQGAFFARFFVQWIASERQQKSVIPLSFWFFSIAGSLMVLAYSIHRRDPVFILGQTTGLLIYVRNLIFIARDRSDETPPVDEP